jgi:Fur family iron response transcriptional regulator
MNNTRPYSAIIERLRGAKLRPTRQRRALARLLFEDGDRHVTAESLHKQALANHERVSLATVYNTLHQFTRAGMLCEVVVDSARSYFDTNTVHHHHFFCEESQELKDIPCDELRLLNLPAPPQGMEINQIDVVIRTRPRGS